jgi:3-phosphoglycerate kinase
MSLSNKLPVTDVDLKGKRVLIRVSFQLSFITCSP